MVTGSLSRRSPAHSRPTSTLAVALEEVCGPIVAGEIYEPVDDRPRTVGLRDRQVGAQFVGEFVQFLLARKQSPEIQLLVDSHE